MKKLGFLLMIVFATFFSCDTDEIFDEAEQLAIDKQLIQEYLAENSISAEQIDDTGIYYSISQPGSGPNAEFASSVYADYRGYLLDGSEFDDGTIDFVVGARQVISGWELGFQELNKGASARLFIPSKYGYGSQRQGIIPQNSVLIFEVTVVDIRSNP